MPAAESASAMSIVPSLSGSSASIVLLAAETGATGMATRKASATSAPRHASVLEVIVFSFEYAYRTKAPGNALNRDLIEILAFRRA